VDAAAESLEFMKNFLGNFTNWFDLLLKAQCPLCQRSTTQTVCQSCRKQIEDCRLASSGQWQGPLPVFAWGLYGGALKRSIAALKYQEQPHLARPLGLWLAQAWLASPFSTHQKLTVIPIPMHAAKQQQRGFNQAELIARSFCQYTGLPLQPEGLVRIRQTEAQFSLSPAEREQNLTDAFEINPRWQRRSTTGILLIDDIYTTGATARAAASVLQPMPVHGLVAVARSGASKQPRQKLGT
jgi:ComF family protein